MDLFFTEGGDLRISHNGDLAVTPTPWRDDVQQAYIRVMTDQGDFLIYPELGASLSELYGMPQSPGTGQYGEELIKGALTREGRFAGVPFSVKAVPVDYNTIRFDITLVSGSRERIEFSVQQELNVISKDED